MGWLTKALSPEDPSAPLWPTSWLGGELGGNDAGVQLNELNSRSAAGVLACVRVISEAGGAYPKDIYEELVDGKRLAKDHPLYSIIHDCPNPQMTNVVFWNAIISQTCIWGNGYAQIQRDGSNRARALWPLPSGSTRPVRENGMLVYRTTSGVTGGGERQIAAADIIHIPFLSFDGLQGYSPIQLKRQSLGLSMAAERFGAKLFGRGARPSGILETTDSLKKEQRDNLKTSMHEGMSGDNALGLALMPPGVTFKPLTINPDDAQFLETRRYQVEDIARDYRVPAHMIGLLERATHSNAEELGYDFSTYTMLHWVLMIEQELNRKLFSRPFYCKLDMDVFLRGDFETRTKGYQLLRNIGTFSNNDINDREGWARQTEEEGGNLRIIPMNFVDLKAVTALKGAPPVKAQPPANPENDPEPQKSGVGATGQDMRERFALGYMRMFQDATGRTINREKRDEAAVKRTWLPVLTGLADSVAALSDSSVPEAVAVFLDDYAGGIAKRCASWHKDQSAAIATAEFERAYTAIVERV